MKNLYNIKLWTKNGIPEFSINDLKKTYQNDLKKNYNQDLKEDKENLEYIFFWGHTQAEDNTITKTCFSQWWLSDFFIHEQKYLCMEQYMMAEKARLFEDKDIEKQILESTKQGKMKALGRKVKNFNEAIWNRYKYSIVLNGNYEKFTQNKAIKDFLIASKNKIIVEASPHDKIWGIGMSIEDKNIENPMMWQGQNLLGFALMEVRNKINKE